MSRRCKMLDEMKQWGIYPMLPRNNSLGDQHRAFTIASNE